MSHSFRQRPSLAIPACPRAYDAAGVGPDFLANQANGDIQRVERGLVAAPGGELVLSFSGQSFQLLLLPCDLLYEILVPRGSLFYVSGYRSSLV
jgi:hypothetical protein